MATPPVLCALSVFCGLRAGQIRDDDPHCILHSEVSSKDVPAFDATLRTLIERGNYNFRSVRFPQGGSQLQHATFESDVDLTDIVVPDTLNLAQATIRGAFRLRSTKIGRILLDGARITGPVDIDIETGLDIVDINAANVDGPVNIRAGQHILSFHAGSTTFREDVGLVTPEIRELQAHEAHFMKSFRVHAQRVSTQYLPKEIGGDLV